MKYYFLCVVFLFIACNKIGIPEPLQINLGNISEKEVGLSEIAESIEYIPLNSPHAIQHLFKIAKTDSFLFVSDYPNGIQMYRKDGKFISMIGRKGGGPGEYIDGYKFAIDESNNRIYVLEKQKIIIYDFQNNFIKNISIADLETNFREIEYINDRLFLFEINTSGYAKYNWVELDTLGQIIYTKSNTVKQFECKIGFNSDCSYKINNSIVYWDKYNDTIFQVNSSGFSAKYVWGNWDNKLPKSNITSKQYENLFLDPYNIIESQDFLFLFYFEKQNYCTAYLNKKDRQFYLVNKSEDFETRYCGPGFINDLDGGLNFAPMENYQNEDGDYLFSWKFAYDFVEYVNSTKFQNSTLQYPEKKAELEELANSLDENDNPILMLVKLIE